jgi:hypothetical protein
LPPAAISRGDRASIVDEELASMSEYPATPPNPAFLSALPSAGATVGPPPRPEPELARAQQALENILVLIDLTVGELLHCKETRTPPVDNLTEARELLCRFDAEVARWAPAVEPWLPALRVLAPGELVHVCNGERPSVADTVLELAAEVSAQLRTIVLHALFKEKWPWPPIEDSTPIDASSEEARPGARDERLLGAGPSAWQIERREFNALNSILRATDSLGGPPEDWPIFELPSESERKRLHALVLKEIALLQERRRMAPVSSVPREAAAEDESAYRPAKEFIDPERFPTFKAIRKALDQNEDIRHRRPISRQTGKPVSNRLEIHAGDWHAFLKQAQAAPEPGELPAQLVVTMVEEVEQRKAEERRRRHHVD